MKIIILFLLLSFYSKGQLNCSIQLIDSYSLKVISPDSSLKIKNGTFKLDSGTNTITLFKLRGKRLEIAVNNYCLYTNRFHAKEMKNKLLKLKLTPNASLVEAKYDEIWNADRIPVDTLDFRSQEELKNYLSGYLRYLSHVMKTCDVLLCGYDNTFAYQVRFKLSGSVYEIDRVIPVLPAGSTCEVLNEHLNKLKTIFPKFRIPSENESFTLQVRFSTY